MWTSARATIAIAALTTLVSLLAMTSGGWIEAMGFVPASFPLGAVPGGLPAWLTPLSSTLVHGGFLHLALNMLMLVWVGAQVERVLGSAAIVVAYVIGAYLAATAQWLVDPASPALVIGASGAISALFGVYALMFGQVKQATASPRANRAIHAIWLLAAWIVLQWMTSALVGQEGVLIATPAHIGGFIAGLILQRPLLLWRYRKA